MSPYAATGTNEQLTMRRRYLLQNMDWLEEELGGFEDDYLIIDCPGEGRPDSEISHHNKTNRSD